MLNAALVRDPTWWPEVAADAEYEALRLATSGRSAPTPPPPRPRARPAPAHEGQATPHQVGEAEAAEAQAWARPGPTQRGKLHPGSMRCSCTSRRREGAAPESSCLARGAARRKPGFPRHPPGYRSRVERVKIVYWSLVSVLGALTFFLLAAGARMLRGRLGGGDPRAGTEESKPR